MPADHGEHSHSDRQLTENDFRNAPKDLVLWGHLAKVGVTRKGGRQHVIVLPAVQALDGKTVTLVGFMTQVHREDRSKQFLLADKPFLCDDCDASPGPAEIVEVNLKIAEPRRSAPIMVRGKLQVMKDDPNGLIYRLTEAKVIRRNLRSAVSSTNRATQARLRQARAHAGLDDLYQRQQIVGGTHGGGYR